MQSELDRLLNTLRVRVDAVAVCEIGRGTRLVFGPLHSIVVHHVVHGRGVLQVHGAPPISFGQDSMLLIPANRRKHISIEEDAASTPVAAKEHCSASPNGLSRLDGTGGAQSDLTIVCSEIQATCGSLGPFNGLSAPLVEDMSDVGAVRLAFQTMLSEQERPDVCATALIETLMKQCLLLFLRRHIRVHQMSRLPPALSDERLARALTAIVERPHDVLRMQDLASSAGMSRSAFAKRFVEALHTTPMEFVRQTRLQRAAELLESTDLPIKTIAGEAGYASRSQFCRAFRVAFEVHPSSYRRCRQAAPAARSSISNSLLAPGHPSHVSGAES